MKNYGICMKKLCAAMLTICMCISFIGCSSRAPFTIEGFTAAAKAAGMEISEESAADYGEAGVSAVATAMNDNSSARVVIFDDAAGSRALYAQIVSTVQQPADAKVTNVDSVSYNKLYIKSAQSYYAIIRVENTLFFGSDEGGSTIEELVKAMGY